MCFVFSLLKIHMSFFIVSLFLYFVIIVDIITEFKQMIVAQKSTI